MKSAFSPRETAGSDFVLGAIALMLAVAYYVLAATIPHSELADTVGPAGLPKTYAVVLAALALVLIAGSLVRRQTASTSAAQSPQFPRGQALRRSLGTLMIGVGYLIAVPWLGYPFSIAGLILTTTAAHGGGFGRRTAVVATCGAIVLWLLFVVLLGIPQPPGMWPSFWSAADEISP